MNRIQFLKMVAGARGAAAALVLAAAMMIASSPSNAVAGPLVDAATLAEEKAATDPTAAYSTIREAFGDFAATLPFSIGKVVFVADKPVAYGAYTPRSGSVFKQGEPLVTYVELIGLAWKPVGDGKQQANFTVDLELSDGKGETLAKQPGFGNFTFTGYVRNQEIFTHLTLDVTGADPGDYRLRYTVNDVVGKRTTSFEQTFSVATE
ncbi:MAG: hypothetical protein ACOH2J_08485 [Allorhizobium sp.]